MFNDVMVDVETTGTNYGKNAIIQIAAVRFDYETEQVSDDFFDRCLVIPAGREWDIGTRHWWLKQGSVLQQIESRAEDPLTVLRDFQAWLCKDWPQRTEGLQFWAKPTSFDHAFLSHYFNWYGVDFPCHYRYARDLNSFMAGLRGDRNHPEMPEAPPLEGESHNAIFDVIHQINLLFHAKRQTVRAMVLP